MREPKKPDPPKRRPGRPETRVIKLDATPEEVARGIFANAKPPDPKRRRKRPGRKSGAKD